MVLTLLTLVAAVLNSALVTLVWVRFGRMRAAWYFAATIAIRTVFAFAHHVVLPAATSPGQVLAVAVLRWALLPIASLVQLLFFLAVYESRWLTNARSIAIAAGYAALAVALVASVLARAGAAVLWISSGAIDAYALGPHPALLVLFNLSWLPGTFVVIRTMVRDRAERLPLAFVLGSTIAGTALGVVASRVGKLGTSAALFDVVVTGSFAYLLLHRRVFETTKIAIDHALRSMVEGIAVISSEGVVLFTNPAMERFLPLRVGHPASAKDARDSVVEELLRSLGSARTEAVIEIERAPSARKSSAPGAERTRRWRSLAVATNPIRDRGGRLHGHLVIAQDVTAARKNERELVRRNEELWRANRVQAQLLRDLEERRIAEEDARRAEEEALRAKAAADAANTTKSAFLARMSHELRTPLNAILGYPQLILRDPQVPERHRRHLEVIGKSGEHLLGLINHVLDLSKIEAGKITVTEAAFDLRALLAGVGEMFRDRARNKGIALLVEADPELPAYVRTDAGKLRQVLINLVGNALKFTQEGRITVRASIAPIERASQPADDDMPRAPIVPSRPGAEDPSRARLLFVVEDTGPGVDAETRESLFQAFSVTGRLAGEGSGLGLSISLELAKVLGGDLRLTSEPGAGARFELTIQAAIAQAEDVARGRDSTPEMAGLQARSSAPPAVVRPEALRAVPAELRAELARAAKSLNPRTTREAIERLRKHDDGLADALDALAGAYRFDRIHDLLHEGKTE